MLELLRCSPPLCSLPDSQRGPGSILHLHFPALLRHFHPRVFSFVCLLLSNPSLLLCPFISCPPGIIKEKKSWLFLSEFSLCCGFFSSQFPLNSYASLICFLPTYPVPRSTYREMRALLCRMNEEVPCIWYELGVLEVMDFYQPAICGSVDLFVPLWKWIF